MRSIFIVVAAAALASCGSESSNTVDTNDGGGPASSDDGGSNSFGGSLDGGGGCVNLQCKQVACAAGSETTLTGTVHAPAKVDADPLFNAIVYVPNAALAPFPKGVSCDQCGALASGSPLVTALSGPDGSFALKNVPVGENVPLVVQLGRWRRQVTIPRVEACTTAALPAELTRLPRDQSEGDIPLHAISTGDADALECVLRKIGVDDKEFTTPSGPGRIHLYRSNGANLPAISAASTLWGDSATLAKYDIVALDCEGERASKPADAKARFVEYTAKGGRLFASHYNFEFLYDTPPFSGTATWRPVQDDPPDPLAADIDTSFPKGKAFAEWLGIVGAQSGPDQISIKVPRHDADDAVPPAQRWISSSNPHTLQHYTFNTPVGAADAAQCGRVVFSDFHVTGITGGSGDKTFPGECDPGPLTPQEKVLEFMFFDLAACVQKDDVPPQPPPVR
jgi:hypothetical protein